MAPFTYDKQLPQDQSMEWESAWLTKELEQTGLTREHPAVGATGAHAFITKWTVGMSSFQN